MNIFPFIKIEGKNYPTVIMGEDNFTGWFGKGKFDSEAEREQVYSLALSTAYDNGVRGFSISPQITMMNVLKEFKKSHPDIICIANHHWQNNYYIGNESLWDKKNLHRLSPTEYSMIDPEIAKVSERIKDADVSNRLSDDEIRSIRLDEDEYDKLLTEFGEFCDFFLVGNISNTALITIGRDDVIRRECEIIRKHGRIPIGMCQGGGLTLPNYEDIDVAGTWVWINRHFAHPTLEYTQKIIHDIKKPITAYKIFQSPEGFNMNESIKFIKSIPQIRSIVVGVENKYQAEETFPKLYNLWN